MPMSFYGSGTMYIGQRDYWPDGSYITTEWFTVTFIPIYPLYSWRVREIGKNAGDLMARNRYEILEKLPRNMTQARSVYSFFLALFMLFILLLSTTDNFLRGIFIGLIAGLGLLALYLRYRSKNRAKENYLFDNQNRIS